MYSTDIYTIGSLFGIEKITVGSEVFSNSTDFAEKYGDEFIFHANNGMMLVTAEISKNNNIFAIIDLTEQFNDFDIKWTKI